MRRERIELTRGAVIKACARDDQQITFLHRVIGRFQPVHAKHAEIVRVIGWQGAKTLKRRDDRNVRALYKITQFLHAVALGNTAANIK